MQSLPARNSSRGDVVLCTELSLGLCFLIVMPVPVMAGYLRLRNLHLLTIPFSFLRLLSSSPQNPSNLKLPLAVFWDLDNKPPNSIPPFDAAVRLNLVATSLGPVRFTVAYANPHAFRHVPAPVLAAHARRLASPQPAVCRVCGRNFYNHSKFLHHFRQIHERENAKRLSRIESARGAHRVDLAAKLSLKINKYRKAAQDVLVPRSGYGLADELRRAGVVVREVEDRPESADRALRAHMMETMDRGRVGCIMLVSDDAGFVPILREARMRCLRTVVVGDEGDGALKRCADASYSWQEVASGKARKEAASAVGRWNDRDLLKGLEWRYVPEAGGGGFEEFDDVREDGGDGDRKLSLAGKSGRSRAWWNLDSDSGELSEKDDQDECKAIAKEGSTSC